MDWTKAYGNAHEEFPIEKDWAIGENRFRVGDIMAEEDFQWAVSQDADFMYVDPPWNQSNISSFFTKAGKQGLAPDFWQFIDRLLGLMTHVKHDSFIEMGNQHVDRFATAASEMGFKTIGAWKITYYGTRPCSLLQVCKNESKVTGLNLNGLDDAQTPFEVCNSMPENSRVMDACTGLGATPIASVATGNRFSGLELNPRRLANAIKGVSETLGRKHGIKQGKHSKRIY